MSEELLEGQSEEKDNNIYIDQINRLKKTTVPIDDYNKLKDENKKLLESLVNDEVIEPTENEPTVEELREKFANSSSMTNLEYVKNALALRNAVIKNGGDDPFLPHGTQYVATSDDIAAANRTAEALQSCVDYANGDARLFNSELDRITQDVRILRK